jgi:hypothetical protein
MCRTTLILMVVIGVGGCGEGRGHGPVADPCRRFASCGACTPIRGCGWCSHGQDGGGICLRDPIECPGPQFTWTWEPVACGAGSDGSATVTEAGATDSDGAGMCRWPAAANTFASADGGLSGCLPSTGGNLCAPTQYTLTCYGNAPATTPSVPDGGLKCAVVTIPTPANVLYYCCPCGG